MGRLLEELDYMHNKVPKCPHCGKDFDVWHGDNSMDLNYDDGGHTTFECVSCGKDFVCVTIVEYKFNTAISEEMADDEKFGPQPADAETV